MFGDKEALNQFTSAELEELFSGTSCFTVPLEEVCGRRIVEVVFKANIFSSIGEAESMVRKGGLYVNFERVKSADELFSKEKHIVAENTTIIRIGKKQNKLIRWT